MASRLSEESLRAAYDSGHKAISLSSSGAQDLLFGTPIDFDALLVSTDPAKEIQALPPQALYHGLAKRGLEDSLDVLGLISSSQLIRIFDYDVWVSDRLNPLKAFKWLQLFSHIGSKELHVRFRQLDEEYQTALLGPFIRMYDEEEYENLSHDHQDRLNVMPCRQLFYELTTDDPRVFEIIEALINATIIEDLNYAYSLIAHAATLPPNEQEAKITQFRRARLEEDGFVTYEESMCLFRPVDLNRIKHECSIPEHQNALIPSRTRTSSNTFLSDVLSHGVGSWSNEKYSEVTTGFVALSNSLCSASRVEPDDDTGLKIVLQQVQALSSLGLEYLAGGEVVPGTNLLENTHPQILFRVGMTLLGGLQEQVIAAFVTAELPKAEYLQKMLRLDKRGDLLRTLDLHFLDILGFTNTEIIKGVMNRYPVAPKAFSDQPDTKDRIIFSPVDSMTNLSKLAGVLDGITGLLHLQTEAQGKGDLEKSILTGVARVLLGQEFVSTPLTKAEVDELVGLSGMHIQSLAGDFLTELEAKLRLELMDTAGNTWSVSRNAGIDAKDPVQNVMNLLTDLMMRLHVQRELNRKNPEASIEILLFVKEGKSV